MYKILLKWNILNFTPYILSYRTPIGKEAVTVEKQCFIFKKVLF